MMDKTTSEPDDLTSVWLVAKAENAAAIDALFAACARWQKKSNAQRALVAIKDGFIQRDDGRIASVFRAALEDVEAPPDPQYATIAALRAEVEELRRRAPATVTVTREEVARIIHENQTVTCTDKCDTAEHCTCAVEAADAILALLNRGIAT